MTTVKKIKPYQLPIELRVKGATAPDGRPYIRVSASNEYAWIPREAFSGTGAAALKMLKEAGIPLLSAEWALCRKKVAQLKAYPVKPLIDRPGWNHPHFALCDGTVFPANNARKPVVLFPANIQKCASQGMLSDWRRMTSTLKGQNIPAFITFAAYAGPLLELSNQVLNLGFELAGPGGVGKSTAQRLAAAVCGPADSPLGVNYSISANATVNGLERVIAEHNDMPLIIEEANLYAAADHVAARAAKFNELVFRLADGTPKLRFSSGQLRRSRFIFITSTNEPLAQLLAGHRVAVAEAAADRLLTIPIDSARPHGIFDFLPEGYENGAALADYFNGWIRKCFGIGIRQFLAGLVAENARSPGVLREEIRVSTEHFRNEAGVDGNDGSETRVADAFGLVYAAGLLAIKYRAISKKIDPLEAALACYKLNRASRPEPVDREALLRTIANDFDTLWIPCGKLMDLTDQEMEDFPAISRERRNGTNELLFTSNQLIRAFPDQRGFFADPRVREFLVAEDGRKQTKRHIRLHRKNERFHCFRIPGLR